jgi:hypothetical protein
MQQALIANSSRHGVNQITQNELKTHGAILNILKQTAASIGGGIVSGRVVDFEHEYDGEHVLLLYAFAALITHEPDLKTQYKLMESMNADIQLMKTKRLLAEAKAEEQMIARRARAAAAPDVPVRPSSPASLAAGQGQGGEGGTDSDPMGFDSPQDHELADAYREASEAMRAREGRTTRRSALQADDSLDDQAMIIHKLEMQVSMAKDMSTLTDKYYGCQDTDELLNYIYANSLLAFSSRLLSLLTASAFQLLTGSGAQIQGVSGPHWGKAQAGARPADDQGHPGAGHALHRPCAPHCPHAAAQAHNYYRVQAGGAEESGTNGSSREDDV